MPVLSPHSRHIAKLSACNGSVARARLSPSARSLQRTGCIKRTTQVSDLPLEVCVIEQRHGFAVTAQQICSTQGVSSIQVRAEVLGGVCEITATVGRGTTVTASLPLERRC